MAQCVEGEPCDVRGHSTISPSITLSAPVPYGILAKRHTLDYRIQDKKTFQMYILYTLQLYTISVCSLRPAL